MAEAPPTTVRIGVIGFGPVGKTSLINLFVDPAATFNVEHEPTVEDEYTTTKEIGETEVTITILDTSGREEYAEMWENYIRDCDGFLLNCTVTDPRSLATLQNLLPRILHAKDLPVVPIVVAVNMCDLDKSLWQLSDQQLAELMDQMKCPVYLTSAKANVNVNEAFTALVHAVLRFKRSIQCGWLTKKGKGGQLFARKNWCRRWFVLSDRYLTYQPEPDSKEVYGKIDIKQIVDVVNGDDDVSFRIETVNRTFYIRADDAESKTIWLRQLRDKLDLNDKE